MGQASRLPLLRQEALLSEDLLYVGSGVGFRAVGGDYVEELGAKLTRLTPEQAEYIDVPVEGPYKAEWYRY